MTGFLLLTAWAGIGIALAAAQRIGSRPTPAWVVAGIAPDSTRYRAHDPIHHHTHHHTHEHGSTRPERTHDTHQQQHI
jgi:ABC-type nickel/cobalt efflux system permease component RcnA